MWHAHIGRARNLHNLIHIRLRHIHTVRRQTACENPKPFITTATAVDHCRATRAPARACPACQVERTDPATPLGVVHVAHVRAAHRSAATATACTSASAYCLLASGRMKNRIVCGRSGTRVHRNVCCRKHATTLREKYTQTNGAPQTLENWLFAYESDVRTRARCARNKHLQTLGMPCRVVWPLSASLCHCHPQPPSHRAILTQFARICTGRAQRRRRPSSSVSSLLFPITAPATTTTTTMHPDVRTRARARWAHRHPHTKNGARAQLTGRKNDNKCNWCSFICIYVRVCVHRALALGVHATANVRTHTHTAKSGAARRLFARARMHCAVRASPARTLSHVNCIYGRRAPARCVLPSRAGRPEPVPVRATPTNKQTKKQHYV